MDYGIEVCDAICTKYKDDVMLQIFILHELHQKTKGEIFNRKINKICSDNNLCDKCYESLHVHKYEDYIGEYHGQKAYEKRIELVCERCERQDEGF